MSHYLRQRPESIEIEYGSWGKPCLSKNEAFLKASGKGWLEDENGLIFKATTSIGEGLMDWEKNLYCFKCIPGYACALYVKGALLYPLHYSWNQRN